MIQCIRSSSWTGYMLIEVRHYQLEVGFVKVPRDDQGSYRMFVNVAAEPIMKFRQSQSSVCLWWNVNSSNKNRSNLAGQIEWAADNGEMFQMRRVGVRFLGSHHFLLITKHTPPPLFLPTSAVLSIHKTEKLSEDVIAMSGTEVVSHVSVKQRMLQSLMSHWKLILALRSSIFFSKHWTLVNRILSRGGM